MNDSGSDIQKELFGGPANLAFDEHGFAWLTNNVQQGDSISSNVAVVLQPNGKPADGAHGTPLSPLRCGGLLGTGFGVTIDPLGNIWFGNFGWGGRDYQPKPGVDGSMSEFSPFGAAISPKNGYVNAVNRAQGLAADDDGNIWITSFSSDSVIVFLGGDPDNAVSFKQYLGSQPFDVALTPDGSAWVSNSGGFVGKFPSSIARFELVGGQLKRTMQRFIGSSLKGLAVDSQGNAWVASLGESVYGIRPDGSLIGQFMGGGINSPWDVTVDGDDNLWVSNFGPLKVTNNFRNGRISKLCGINRAACPPGAKTGDPISPPSGYTLPSAGSEVLLANGDPLYGPGAPPSFSPMMRQTASQIDRAGNVWTINNWKPDFYIDKTSNPGGDGIVIFVGLASPP